ncbi:Ltp family lipoprotein [Companilactobacillus kimchiensis]|uniref:Superinfection immunity protein n=1 Tax=Companilactobacillus kimchiensis TaxID=993692 RepID=A0A0R2LP29_9LACO|nr:Ltp family lipoprotein [Companilactobacillus kimchiensis]KRO00861.1 superinfection immunity protein [Companilactobacillus kimchiensis]
MRNSKNTVKKKWYQKKRFWIWSFIVLIIIMGINSIGGSSSNSNKEASNKISKVNNKKVNQENNKEEKSETSSNIQESDNVPTEYKTALRKAKTYSGFMHMSKLGVQEQLTSEYGEKYSQEAAQYAIDNVQADWNKNALAKAKSYQKDMSMSPEGIRDQLTSEYGEKFTPEEAEYAINNLK